MDNGEIIIYQSDDKSTQFEVRIEDDTVWLTQAQMVDLFGRDRSVITRHINNVFNEKELVEESNVHFLHIAISDKPIKLYSLDVIISVGYRIKSPRGTQFRIWANKVLKNYLLKGYAIQQQFENIENNRSHDRFLIIDQTIVYHIGASMKDLGKKWFAFFKIDLNAMEMLKKLQ